MSNRRASAALGFFLLVAVPRTVAAHVEQPSALPTVAVAPLRIGDSIPALVLEDQDGRAFTFARFSGKFALVSFVYTRCRDKDFCPLVAARFAQLQNRLGSESQLVLVTLDPGYDRPAVLRGYARRYAFRGERVTLATGEPRAVAELVARFGLSSFADPKNGLVHDELAALVDPGGKLAERFGGTSWTTDEIVSVVAHYGSRPQPAVPWKWLFFVGVCAAAGWLVVRLARRRVSEEAGKTFSSARDRTGSLER
ncbi:MAG: SCO family protein [Candidatus Eremiobacteraeota bacterium]|nr:SCO family protein [Candidatus Eremiobacteraeota bacterium]